MESPNVMISCLKAFRNRLELVPIPRLRLNLPYYRLSLGYLFHHIARTALWPFLGLSGFGFSICLEFRRPYSRYILSYGRILMVWNESFSGGYLFLMQNCAWCRFRLLDVALYKPDIAGDKICLFGINVPLSLRRWFWQWYRFLSWRLHCKMVGRQHLFIR